MSTSPLVVARRPSDPPVASSQDGHQSVMSRRVRDVRDRLHGLERHRRHIWTLIWIGLAGTAAYVLLPELEGLYQSLGTLEAADPRWLLAGAGIVALRYVMTVVSLQMAVGRPIPFGPTLLVQVSTSFIGRLTPEGVGWLVLNQRYLERLGIGRASALAAITLKVLAGGVMRLAITAAVAMMAGASGLFEVQIPNAWPYFILVVLVVLIIAVMLRSVLGSAVGRVMAPVVAGGKDLLGVFRQPVRAVVLLGSSAALTVANALALMAGLMAFGVDASLVQVSAVYLGATAVAAASPTPGNLGAVEVALTAGLTAIGIASAPAVAAVVVYRLLTFWLPLLPGFIAFRYLQHRQHI
jgi:glycosyltransferase 2 family protein